MPEILIKRVKIISLFARIRTEPVIRLFILRIKF
jgi:hypothetical protein